MDVSQLHEYRTYVLKDGRYRDFVEAIRDMHGRWQFRSLIDPEVLLVHTDDGALRPRDEDGLIGKDETAGHIEDVLYEMTVEDCFWYFTQNVLPDIRALKARVDALDARTQSP